MKGKNYVLSRSALLDYDVVPVPLTPELRDYWNIDDKIGEWRFLRRVTKIGDNVIDTKLIACFDSTETAAEFDEVLRAQDRQETVAKR